MSCHELIALVDLPAHLPPRRGRRVSLASIYRWNRKGVRRRKLRTLAVGGVLYTSVAWLREFLDGAAEAPDSPTGQPLIQANLRAKGLK
jgi:hypothetical protein